MAGLHASRSATPLTVLDTELGSESALNNFCCAGLNRRVDGTVLGQVQGLHSLTPWTRSHSYNSSSHYNYYSYCYYRSSDNSGRTAQTAGLPHTSHSPAGFFLYTNRYNPYRRPMTQVYY